MSDGDKGEAFMHIGYVIGVLMRAKDDDGLPVDMRAFHDTAINESIEMLMDEARKLGEL